MSERNVGLFVPGHLTPEHVARALLDTPGVDPAELQGEEAPRVGHGTWKGRPYTHVGLRLFEVGGLLLFDGKEVPGADEVEMRLGAALSRQAGSAVYLRYDDEAAVGGHARFEAGRLVSRAAIDGRESRPVLRHLSGERLLEGVDASDWVWTPIAEAVADGARPIFGDGVRNDDDIEALIEAAAAKPISLQNVRSAPAPAAAAPQAARPEPAPRAAPPPPQKGLLGKLASKVADKIRR